MTIVDIMIDRSFDEESISLALTDILPITASDIIFRSDPSTPVSGFPRKKVIVTHWSLRGDFKENLRINLVDQQLREMSSSQPDEEFFQEFCRLANCSCLLSDEDLNPWTYTLIKPNGEMHSVEIEAEDEEDEDLVELMPQFKHLID